MSQLFDLACSISRANAAGAMANHAELQSLRARVRDLEVTLARMVAEHEETESNTEGRYPCADHGCIECTLGTVPDNLNTGLCAYHKARQLLGL